MLTLAAVPYDPVLYDQQRGCKCKVVALERMKRLGEVMRSGCTVFNLKGKHFKKRVSTLHYCRRSTAAATFSLLLRLKHVVFERVVRTRALNQNPSSHWFWRICAFFSFFSSSCPSSSCPSSFSFSCCDGGQRRKRRRRSWSCLNWRRWCPEAAAAAAGSWKAGRTRGEGGD